MKLKKSQKILLGVLVATILGFSYLFLQQSNAEFLIYVGVIVFFTWLVLASHQKVNYSNTVLVGLAIWAILHMAGGGVFIEGTKLYELILIDINAEYEILKYDQAIHFYGFFIATLVMYEVLKPHLKKSYGWLAVGIILIMTGSGLGALNEVVEFFATVVTPETGVGGYTNTALDLVFNLLGATTAVMFLRYQEA